MKSRYATDATFIASAIVLLAVGSCSRTIKQGADVNALAGVKIEKSKTTKAELVKQLGAANSVMIHGDGTEILSWSGAVGEEHDSAFMMLMPFAASAAHMKEDVHSVTLQATVKDGIVIDFTLLDGNQRVINF